LTQHEYDNKHNCKNVALHAVCYYRMIRLWTVYSLITGFSWVVWFPVHWVVWPWFQLRPLPHCHRRLFNCLTNTQHIINQIIFPPGITIYLGIGNESLKPQCVLNTETKVSLSCNKQSQAQGCWHKKVSRVYFLCGI